MTIRTKLTLLIVLCVAVPLALSAVFWVNTIAASIGDMSWTALIGRGRAEAEDEIARRFSRRAAERNRALANALTPVAERVDRELTALGARFGAERCFTGSELRAGCHAHVHAFLGRNPEIEGFLAFSGSRFTQILNREGHPEREAAIREALLPLARAGVKAALAPVQVTMEFILASVRAPGEVGDAALLAWSTPAAVMEPIEGLLGGGVFSSGLMDDQGRLLLPLELGRGSEASEPRVVFDLALADPEQRRQALEDVRSGRSRDGRGGLAGTSAVFAYAPIPDTGLRVVTLMPLDVPLAARVSAALWNYLGVAAALVVLTAVGAMLLAMGMTRRLRMLTIAAEAVGAGRLDVPIEARGRDEVARLAGSFRAMAEQLRATFATLEQKVAERTRDLTLRTEELARVNEDLVRLTKLKDIFFANMSHELRTPLNSIIGFSELLLAGAQGAITDKQRDGLGRVVRNAKHLLQLINDILDLAKIEADRFTFKLGPVNLKALAESAVSNFEVRASERKISLRTEVDPAIPTLQADEVRVLQVLNNLLSNAVKFTHAGGVTLTASPPAPGWVEIAVKDTGIGIDEADLANLFTEFYQADRSHTRRYEGTGLGLAITKRLVEAMGGSIAVASRKGQGTTFTVRLPVVTGGDSERVTPPAPSVAPREATAGARSGRAKILIVDDEQEVHTLIVENLRQAGADFLHAMDGEEGLRLARDARPDLILLDVRLPVKDGWEVLHDLKADPQTEAIPVVIMSVVDNKSLGFSLGAADYLVKPVNRDWLFSMLARLSIAPESGYILVVDDDREAATLLMEALRAQGFRVTVTHDGRQALEAVRRQPPRLIVLDLIMPEMDGFETLEHLKSEALSRDIPVVILTGKDLTAGERAELNGKIQALFQKGRGSLAELISDVQRVILGPRAGP